MALQINLPDPYGLDPLTTAYAKVSHINLNLDFGSGLVVVNVFANIGARRSGKPPITQRIYQITPDDSGGILAFARLNEASRVSAADAPGTLAYDIVRRSIYNALKTLDEFAGSLDV